MGSGVDGSRVVQAGLAAGFVMFAVLISFWTST